MRRAHVFLLAVATIVVAARETRAQCGTGKQTKINTFTITPIALTLPTATSALFVAGWSQSSYSVSVNPQTGQRWFLCASPGASMGTVDGYTKPISDLQWSLDGTTWTSFSATPQQAITNDTGASTFTLFIRARLQFANDVPQANSNPGTYGTSLAFTVAM